jgi:hypothetical protein
MCLAIISIGFQTQLSQVAASDYLYGIHWWGYGGSLPVSSGPATMLDCPDYGGWTVETVITNSASWWGASYFANFFAALRQQQNMTIITRIDYNWGETVPSPTNPDYATWPTTCVNVVNTLRNDSNIWIIGNEPNVTSEGDNWPNNHVTPAGYAQIYRDVRNAIHNNAQASPLGEHIVLVAAPSPGGAMGIRWMGGNDWLGQVLDNIPDEEVDGIALHAYGGSLADFHNGYVDQLNLIDSKGLQHVPTYLTEWNKVSTEPVMAQFVRDCYADLNTWNQTPSNHNVRCLCWFVYDSNDQAGGGWDSYSIEYYRYNGEPLGSSDNLYTAFAQTVDLRYPAGIVGTRSSDPSIYRWPSSFSHTIFEGDTLPADTLNIENSGGNTLNYTLSDNAAWISLSPTSGSCTTETDPITVNYDVAGLTVGSYNATITINATGAINSPQLVTVSLTVDTSPYAPADFNRDYYVDVTDFTHLQNCLNGSGMPITSGCNDADLDEDGDVDQGDFGIFQRCFSGTLVIADAGCAE